MNLHLTCVLYGGVALAIAVMSPPAAGKTARPMQPYHNHDGNIMRGGIKNSIVTGYWSGYAVTASAPYTSASATWQVPSATGDSLNPGLTYGEDAVAWVGIGGDGDSTLIQLGSGVSVSPTGYAIYNVWYELYPAGGMNIPHNVNPGDIIAASLTCTANCSPGATQTWLLSMQDQTLGWTWTQNFQYQSSMASAEWILEAPFGPGGELPLANYGQMTFNPVAANGQNPNLSLANNGIIMQDPAGETSNPSDPAPTGDAFSTCWGFGSLTPCTFSPFVTPPQIPTASLSASPTKISSGQSSTLTWSSTNTSSCTGSNFPASGTSGSAVVSPSITTSYSITCNGDGLSATAVATVTVTTCHGKHCK